jgi:SAM-dependent methyltransferase
VADSKQAEKTYLSTAGTERWERVKPFSSPGHDDVAEGARLIHDFGAALQCLRPSPGSRVLDLGAGSGWVSEWLRRFNVETVTVDIAVSMLGVARTRLGPKAWIIAGDLEQLPLAAGSVDHAICLNALHHVPDTVAALRETWRVLRPGGRLVVGEPGRGHEEGGTSRAASDAFGVQERALPPDVLLDACRAAGFSRSVVKPLLSGVEWYEVEPARWARWRRHAGTRRPLRAARRVGRALIEFAGWGKNGPAFEDAIGMELVRIVHDAADSHPVVLATK